MRQSVAEAERSTGKKGAVPITVRQLEAIIRISGRISNYCWFLIFYRILGKNETISFCHWAGYRRSTAPFQGIHDGCRLIWRAFRCWRYVVSFTIQISIYSGFETASDQEDLNRIERQIKRRFLIGSQVSEKSIVGDLTKQNYPERSVTKVLQVNSQRFQIMFAAKCAALVNLWNFRLWSDEEKSNNVCNEECYTAWNKFLTQVFCRNSDGKSILTNR